LISTADYVALAIITANNIFIICPESNEFRDFENVCFIIEAWKIMDGEPNKSSNNYLVVAELKIKNNSLCQK
jgi:hypothetical protein